MQSAANTTHARPPATIAVRIWQSYGARPGPDRLQVGAPALGDGDQQAPGGQPHGVALASRAAGIGQTLPVTHALGLAGVELAFGKERERPGKRDQALVVRLGELEGADLGALERPAVGACLAELSEVGHELAYVGAARAMHLELSLLGGSSNPSTSKRSIRTRRSGRSTGSPLRALR